MDARRWFQFGYEDLFVFFSWWTWRTRTESPRRAASSVTSRWTLKTSRWVKWEETALHHRLNNEKHAEWDYCQNICDREDYNQFIRNQAFTSDLCAWVHTWSSSSAPPGVWQDRLIPSQTESQSWINLSLSPCSCSLSSSRRTRAGSMAATSQVSLCPKQVIWIKSSSSGWVTPPSVFSGLCGRKQKEVSKAIKKAQSMGTFTAS